MKNYIAKRFQHAAGGLSLNTAALEKYSDVIDLSIGDTDFTTDRAIIRLPRRLRGAHALRRPARR